MPARRSPAPVRPMFERLRKLFGAPLPTGHLDPTSIHGHSSTSPSSSSSSSSSNGFIRIHHHHQELRNQSKSNQKRKVINSATSAHRQHHQSRSSSKRLHNSANRSNTSAAGLAPASNSTPRRPLSARQQRIRTLQKQIGNHQSSQTTCSSSAQPSTVQPESQSPPALSTSFKTHYQQKKGSPETILDTVAKKKCVRSNVLPNLSNRPPQTNRHTDSIDTAVVRVDTCNNIICDKENEPLCNETKATTTKMTTRYRTRSSSHDRSNSMINSQQQQQNTHHAHKNNHHNHRLQTAHLQNGLHHSSSSNQTTNTTTSSASRSNHHVVSSNTSHRVPPTTSFHPSSSSNDTAKISRSSLPRRSSSFKHRQQSPPPAISFIQILLDSVASRPRQPDVLFGSTCDQLPDRHLHPFNENVVAAFTGPGDGLAELQQKQQQPAILSSNELASVKACTRMLDSLQVDFIDDEDSSDSNGDLSPIPIKSPVQTYSDLLKSIDRKRSIPATNKSSPNVYSFAHTDLRPGNSTSTPKLMDKDRNYREIRTDQLNVKPIRSIDNWKQSKSFAFGASVSLYEQHPADGRKAGEPLADCFGIVARGNNACLALADGVNWGPGSRLAATSAVNGAIEYLNSVLIETKVQTTTQLFEQLLRAFSAAHEQILMRNGHLTTLTVAVIAQMQNSPDFVACTCNVGDSLAYVYSARYGVREITQGSHDIYSMRDMRDALGALGPVDGNNPLLGNLTVAMTLVERGDIVFVTSDGVSDNFDPVVGKFALARRPQSDPPSEASIKPIIAADSVINHRKERNLFQQLLGFSRSSKVPPETVCPSLPRTSRSSGLRRSNSNPGQRSRDAVQARAEARPSIVIHPPSVTAEQRHVLGLLQMEQILNHGLQQSAAERSLQDDKVKSAEQLVARLLQYVHHLTSAKRSVLQDPSLYDLNDPNHFCASEQKLRRRKVAPNLASLPGKLDHATVVAFQVDFYGSQCESMKTLQRCPRYQQTLKATLAKNSLDDL